MPVKYLYKTLINHWEGIHTALLTDTICLTVSALSSVYSFILFSRVSKPSLESFSFSTLCLDSNFNCCSTSSSRCTVDCRSFTSLFGKKKNQFTYSVDKINLYIDPQHFNAIYTPFIHSPLQLSLNRRNLYNDSLFFCITHVS